MFIPLWHRRSLCCLTGRVHPKRRCCTYLCFYKFIRAVGVLSCLLVALLNLFALVDQTGDSGKGDAVAKIAAVGHLGFLILIAVVLCLAFFELGFVMTWLQVLDTWFGLGGTLLFLAFSTLDKANGQDTNYDSRMKLAVQVMCYILVSVRGAARCIAALPASALFCC